jgi:c-di-GMP-binding flagellar brake protein YcgR
MTLVLQRERRRFGRVPFGGPVRAEQIPQPVPNRRWQLLSEDLSEGGLRLSSPDFLAVEQRVLLDVDTATTDDPIRIVGKVVWIAQVPYADQWQVGVYFSDVPQDMRSRLRRIAVRQQATR